MHRVSIEAGATLLTADISASMPLPDKDSNLDLLDQNQASLPLDHPGKLTVSPVCQAWLGGGFPCVESGGIEPPSSAVSA